jgi:hypothetical protein
MFLSDNDRTDLLYEWDQHSKYTDTKRTNTQETDITRRNHWKKTRRTRIEFQFGMIHRHCDYMYLRIHYDFPFIRKPR